MATLATGPACLGCTFQTTAAEFPDLSRPGHAVALAHKQAVRDRLRELAIESGARYPDALADGLLVLMDGAFACTRMYGRDIPAAVSVPPPACSSLHIPHRQAYRTDHIAVSAMQAFEDPCCGTPGYRTARESC